MFRVAAINLDFTGGSAGVLVPLRGHAPGLFQFGSKAYFYYVALGLMLASCALAAALRRSRVGFYWAAIREDEAAAQVTGVDAYRYKLLAMAVSAALTALGGSFYAQYFSYIDPGIAFGPTASVEILLRPVVGGAGTVLGPVVGAFLMGGLAEGTRGLVKTYSGVHLMIYGVLLMLVVMRLPHGVMGWVQDRLAARRTPDGA
jgi:branched-chain amino acid transport system permease protein